LTSAAPCNLLFDCCVFDLDGTLIEGAQPIIKSVQKASQILGWRVPDADEIREKAVGPPEHESTRNLFGNLPQHEIDAFSAAYKAAHQALFLSGEGEHIFEGLEPLLNDLKKAGGKLGVLTNMARARFEEINKTLKLKETWFPISKTCSDGRPKPSPDMLLQILEFYQAAPSNSVMIGDTFYDMRAGKAASMATIAVTWGNGSREALTCESPDYLVDTPQELAMLLLGMDHHAKTNSL